MGRLKSKMGRLKSKMGENVEQERKVGKKANFINA